MSKPSEASSGALPSEAALSALYRRHRSAQPTPAIDLAIRTQAYREAHRRKLVWRWPLASAALILLGLTLVLKLTEPPLPRQIAPTMPLTDNEQAAATTPFAQTTTPSHAPTRLQAAKREIDIPALPPTWAPQNAELAKEKTLANTPAPPAQPTIATEVAQALARIRTLLDAGRMQEAIEQLENFRQNYPGLALPADLQNSLGKGRNFQDFPAHKQ
jgi:hypothetical protein